MTSERPLPALTVETTRIADPGPLVSVLASHSPLLWRQRGFGMAGFGEALRLEFSGENRMTDAAAAWRGIVADASVNDPLRIPGSGLVALGTFAFAADSRQSSVLIVPSLVVGRSGNDFWLTRIGTGDLPAAELPVPSPLDEVIGAQLVAGEMTSERYLAAVEAAIGQIRAGDLSKVVVARDLVGTVPADADQRPAIMALAEGYPDCWTFAIDGFIGASPETLVSVKGGTS